MPETKHTPGPWKANTQDWEHRTVLSVGSDDLKIAIVNLNMVDRKTEGKANAHLIAAAPDLLEALEAIEKIVCFGDMGPFKDEAYYAFSNKDDVAIKLTAAIQKAKGE